LDGVSYIDAAPIAAELGDNPNQRGYGEGIVGIEESESGLAAVPESSQQ